MGSQSPGRRAVPGGRSCGQCCAVLASDNTGSLCSTCVREQRDQYLSPPARLPDDFWETDDFKAAFKAQDLGKVLRVYRNHEHLQRIYGRSISQSTLGRWLHFEQTKVSRIETGGSNQPPQIVRECATRLHIPQRLLWILPEGESYFTVQNRMRDTSDLELDRRGFMSMASGVAILGMAAPFHSELSSCPGLPDVDYLIRRTARMRRLDNHLGGRDTYGLYVSELASTVGYVRNASSTPEIRRALIRIIAEQAQLAGWAAFDAGMHAEAKKHYQDSFEAAKEAEDAVLAGNALAFLAYQEVSTIGPNVGLAEASFDAAEAHATPRVRALLLERKAWTHAVAGDYQSSIAALSDAKVALHIESSQPEPDWVFWVDDNEIDIMTGRCLTELHRPLDAVASLDKALARFDSTYARDKALYSTFLANALIDAEEIERAAFVTANSIDLAQGVGSVRPSARIADVMHRLRSFREIEPVARLFEMRNGN